MSLQSGQGSFRFVHRADLHRLPEQASSAEVHLHGGFAVDQRPDRGESYYGVPGAGVVRISADLSAQDLLDLPADLRPLNFHSTKLGEFEGKLRLFLPANDGAMVAVVSLDGHLDFVLPKPEFEEYTSGGFHPTDTALVNGRLYVADGYGQNYISTADLASRRWTGKFGGRGGPTEHGTFGTAHGLNRAPSGDHLSIADRPHSRFELTGFEGQYLGTRTLPEGSRPCGIDFTEIGGRWYAVVGSLDDPTPGRPAPIYVLDAETYEVISTIRPKEELGLEKVDHLHNVVWRTFGGRTYLLCQAWNPGFFFVLELGG